MDAEGAAAVFDMPQNYLITSCVAEFEILSLQFREDIA